MIKTYRYLDFAAETILAAEKTGQKIAYEVVNIGWHGLTRIFGCIIYVEIRDGKIWVERDYRNWSC